MRLDRGLREGGGLELVLWIYLLLLLIFSFENLHFFLLRFAIFSLSLAFVSVSLKSEITIC